MLTAPVASTASSKSESSWFGGTNSVATWQAVIAGITFWTSARPASEVTPRHVPPEIRGLRPVMAVRFGGAPPSVGAGAGGGAVLVDDVFTVPGLDVDEIALLDGPGPGGAAGAFALAAELGGGAELAVFAVCSPF